MKRYCFIAVALLFMASYVLADTPVGTSAESQGSSQQYNTQKPVNDMVALPVITPEKIIAKYTNPKTGVIDYKGLADYLQKRGDTKLAADVLTHLIKTVKHKLTGGNGYDLKDLNGVLSQMTDMKFLKNVNELIASQKTTNIVGNISKQSVLLKAVGDRFNTLAAGNPAGLIAAYTDNTGKQSLIDYKGLGSYLEKKGDAKLTGDVLIGLVDRTVVVDRTIIGSTQFNLTKVKTLLGTMSNVMQLQSVAKYLLMMNTSLSANIRSAVINRIGELRAPKYL